jgi:nitrogenase molybdenum-iron protein beta chain
MPRGNVQPSIATEECVRHTSEVTDKTNSIEQVRYACSIGAMLSVSAIPGAIPIAHCGPGCAGKQYESLATANGHQGRGFGGGSIVPSTNATEREAVFGGEERLDELIESTLKLIKSDLFVVVTGCIADLVGDDVGSVVGRYQRQGVPIVFAETGGFKGNNFTGHEVVTRAIIDQYVGDYAGPHKPGSVNVWSLLPYQNTFWRGDLTEIKRILEGIGLRVNILFGPTSSGVSEWKNIPKAQFNLVLSPWLGLETARHLEEKYGQPFLHVPVIPIGAKETTAFLRKVAEFAGVARTKAEAFIRQEEALYYNYLGNFADFYAGFRYAGVRFGLPVRFAVAGDSAYNLAITKFSVNQLGLIPTTQIVTENPPEPYRAAIREEYLHIAEDVSTDVVFEEDGFLIHERLRSTDFANTPAFIFGTTWESDLAREISGVLVEIGFPTAYEVVLARTYVGYQGGLAFLEKIYSSAIRDRVP